MRVPLDVRQGADRDAERRDLDRGRQLGRTFQPLRFHGDRQRRALTTLVLQRQDEPAIVERRRPQVVRQRPQRGRRAGGVPADAGESRCQTVDVGRRTGEPPYRLGAQSDARDRRPDVVVQGPADRPALLLASQDEAFTRALQLRRQLDLVRRRGHLAGKVREQPPLRG